MRNSFIFIIFLAFTGILSAQQEEQLSLEQLIPGGKQYANYYPRIPVQYQWYGNRLAAIENDTVWMTDNPARSQRKKIFLTYKEMEEGLEESDNKIHSLTFSPEGSPLLRFHTFGGTGMYDPEKKVHRA